MGTVLMTWELGSGLGHILPLLTIGERFERRGHRVFMATRELARTTSICGKSDIKSIQAPIFSPDQHVGRSFTGMAQILAAEGYSNAEALVRQLSKWDALFDEVRPVLVLADYSPTALLALRGTKIPKVNIGLSFCCPPDRFPLPHWWTGEGQIPTAQLAAEERTLTATINRALAAKGKPAVERISQLFNQVDELVLATYREFDHFGGRGRARYWGHWHADSETPAAWPSGDHRRAFVYLRPFAGIEGVFGALRQSGVQCLVHAGSIPESIRAEFEGQTIHFEAGLLPMGEVATQCDFAIVNGGHGTTASLLLAGRPCLVLPMTVEQWMNAYSVERAGAGAWLLPRFIDRFSSVLGEFLNGSRYLEGATRFARRYAGFTPGEQIDELVDRMEGFMPSSAHT